VKPHVFANGGDRKPDDDPVPEVAMCEELGIRMVYNAGAGGKIQSSSWLTAKLAEHKKNKKRSDTKNAPRKLRAKRKRISLKHRQAFAR
jgi:hypothetical protein